MKLTFNRAFKSIFIIIILFLLFSCTVKQNRENSRIRIISLAPNITEVLFALDLDDQVVAVSDYCTYPPQAKQKESIGGLLNPNLEKITAMQPDFVIGTESYRDLALKLDGKDFKVILLPEKTVQDVYITIDSVGHLTGRQNKADSLILAIKDSLNVYKAVDGSKSPSAILVLGRSEGGTRNISISSTGAFINELWEFCGGRNAFHDLGSSFAQVNREDLLMRNPDLIIEFKSNKNWTLDLDKANRAEWADLKIAAVKNNRIYIINGNHYLTPGPRMHLLAREYQRILHSYFEPNTGENQDNF